MSAITGAYIADRSHDEWTLAPGDEPPLAGHLVTPRGFYTRHGVYVGHGRVVHYAGLSDGLRNGRVQEISIEQFARGRGIRVRAGTSRSFDCQQVIERARSRLGEDRYRILTNNCEHFCEWCLRGRSRSTQIEAWRARPRAALRKVHDTLSRLLTAMLRTGRLRLPRFAGI